MSDLSTNTAMSAPARKHAAHTRPCIELPNGEVAEPRRQFAENTVGATDRTVRKWDLPTLYVAGVAYILRNASLAMLAERARRRNEPYLHRRPGRKPTK